MRVDAHQHFWRYNEDEYAWIRPGMEALKRDFLPEHLEPELHRAGIDKAISVQARQTLAETQWLLELAAQFSFIAGVVGWVPLTDPSVEEKLVELASNSRLKGVRHVVQDEPDDHFILREDFNRGVGLLHRFGLVYDILIYERHLPQAIRFVDRHPEQIFVLDHIAKPRIRDGILEPWATHIQELARRPNVYCKVSGMVTEADWCNWTEDGLRRYFDIVLEAFGARRLMFGSDWPVCLLASTYERWARCVETWINELSLDEREAILGATASRVYRLE